MQINTTFLLYTLLTGFLISLNTFAFTLLKSNPIIALFWEFLLLVILQALWVFLSKKALLPPELTGDVPWIVLMAFTAIISSYVFARAFQEHHFNPAAFSLSNTLISSVFLVVLGYFFLKSSLNVSNFLGMIFGVIAILLLNMK